MNDDAEWFPLSDDLWRDPHEIPKKLRILADHNIPARVVAELRKDKIRVTTAAEIGAERLADRELLNLAKKRGEVLLTTDGDFWSDQQYPPEQDTGVIFVDTQPGDDKVSRVLSGFLPFAKSFSQSGCRNLKMRLCADKFFFKLISYQGQRVSYEVQNRHGRLLCRTLDEPV